MVIISYQKDPVIISHHDPTTIDIYIYRYIGKSGFRILIIAPGDGITFNTLLGTILFDTKRWRDGLEVLARAAVADIDGTFPQGRNALVSACEMQDVTVVEGVVSSSHREVGHCWSMLQSSKIQEKKGRRLVSMRLVGLNLRTLEFFCVIIKLLTEVFFLMMGMKVRLQKERKLNEKRDLSIGCGAIPISLKYHFLNM